MLALNYNNNMDESFLDYQQFKNMDAMATLSNTNRMTGVNGSMPGYLNRYKNKSTDQLDVASRHNSVVLTGVNMMHLNKYRDGHNSLHHLHPSSAYSDNKVGGNRDEMCASADDLCEKGQLETSDKKKSILSRIKCKLERRKTSKA